jgi:phosphoglycolate phosphatase
MRPGLIFDLDGTLVDSLPGIAASLNRSLGQLGLPTHGSAAIRGFIGNGSLELARKAVPAGSPDDLAHQVEVAFKEDYAETWPGGTAPYPGIPECLATLAAAGIPAVAVAWGYHDLSVLEAAGADLLVEKIHSLPGILGAA